MGSEVRAALLCSSATDSASAVTTPRRTGSLPASGTASAGRSAVGEVVLTTDAVAAFTADFFTEGVTGAALAALAAEAGGYLRIKKAQMTTNYWVRYDEAA